ncbi:hypothetical protein B0H13DRAFT_1900231 [Mycena leptocephala]|nr:hypothetical protein B0H13DRAFT_1900231 [Mycena leptocephala]
MQLLVLYPLFLHAVAIVTAAYVVSEVVLLCLNEIPSPQVFPSNANFALKSSWPLRWARWTETPVVAPLRTIVYSPAQDVVSYSPVVFHHSVLASLTKYPGLGMEVDKAWRELYHYGPSIITEDEAKQLPSWTQPLTVAGEQKYSTLNLARMSLYPEHYSSPAHHARTSWSLPRHGPPDHSVKEWASARMGSEEFQEVLMTPRYAGGTSLEQNSWCNIQVAHLERIESVDVA